MNYFLRGPGEKLAKPHTLLGIEGLLVQIPGPNGLWVSQQFVAAREFKKQGGLFELTIEYDRGHPSNTQNGFTMRFNFDGVTGPLDIEMAVKFWPELAHLVKWHLSCEGEPLHYIANTKYWAAQGNLEYARKGALWLDAPEEILTGPPMVLERALKDRRKALVDEFKEALAATGLLFTAPQ